MPIAGLLALMLSPNLQAAPALATCELHVWPAERLDGLGFSLYNGLIQGRASGEQIEGAMTDLLSPASQVAALGDRETVSGLEMPTGTRFVRHAEPLDPKTVTKVKTRRAQSQSRCYSELIMVRHLLVEDIVWGDRFLSTFVLREFGGGAEAVRTAKGVGGNKLKVLTQANAVRPGDAPELVAAALRANFAEYAKNAREKTARRAN